MKVKTFVTYLPKLDIAFNQEKLIDLQSKLDEEVGIEKTIVTTNPTPLNAMTSYTVAIWALGITEAENVTITRKIEDFLKNNEILFNTYESLLTFKEDKLYLEVEICSRNRD